MITVSLAPSSKAPLQIPNLSILNLEYCIVFMSTLKLENRMLNNSDFGQCMPNVKAAEIYVLRHVDQ